MVAPGQQRLARGRAQRRRVEAVVLEPVRREPLRGGRRARPAEGARRAEAHVVEQDHQHVRRALRRAQRLDRRERRVRVLRVVGDQSRVGLVGDRQDVSLNLVGHARRLAEGRVTAPHLVRVNRANGTGQPGSAQQPRLLRGELLVGQDPLLVELPELLELLDRVGGGCRRRRRARPGRAPGRRIPPARPSVDPGDGLPGSRRRSRCRRPQLCGPFREEVLAWLCPFSQDAASAASRASIRSCAGMRSNATGTPPLRRTAEMNGAAQRFS